MKTKIEDLRQHLFASLERLGEENTEVDLDREKAIVGTAKALIELAKTEVNYLKVTQEYPGRLEFFQDANQIQERARIGLVK